MLLSDNNIAKVVRMRRVQSQADAILVNAQRRDREKPLPDAQIRDNKTRLDTIQGEFEKVDDVNNMLLEAIKTKLAILDH